MQFFALILRDAARKLDLDMSSLDPEHPHQFSRSLSRSEWGDVRKRVLDELLVLDGTWYGTPEVEFVMDRFRLSFADLAGSDLLSRRTANQDAEDRAQRQRRSDRSVDRGLTQVRRWESAQSLSRRSLPEAVGGGSPGGHGPSAWGDPGLKPFVHQLRKMPPSERLEHIASQSRFTPTALPADVIPLRTVPLSLSLECAATLVSSLESASGEWGALAERLRRLLEVRPD